MSGEKRFLEDDFNEPVHLIRTAEGLTAFLPKSASRLTGEALESVRQLQGLGHYLNLLEQQAEEVARDCREDGISWSLIGWCLGITGETARLRYADSEPQ